MSIHQMLDAISDVNARTRSNYHLTLVQAITALSVLPPDLPVTNSYCAGTKGVDSYRGYYSDLALEPYGQTLTVAELLDELRNALGKTFEGYKGGDFTMTENTPLWISEYGEASGIAVVGITVVGDKVVLQTKDTNDE